MLKHERSPGAGWRLRVGAIAVAAGLIAGACGGASPSPTVNPTSPGATPTGEPAGPTPLTLPTPEVTSLKIGISTLEANTFIPKFAADLGLYEKYGITDVEVIYFEGAQRNLQAIIANQIQVASDSPQTTLTSMTSEEPLQDVAIYANGFLDCILAAPEITTDEALVGKRIAVSGIGGQSHAVVLVALQSMGIDMNDVNIVTIGGQSARVAALEAGSVDAAPVDCALSEELTQSGFNILVRLPEVDIDFPTSNLSFKRSFIEENPNTVLAVVAANLEAMQVMFSDEERAVESLVAWSQVEEADARSAIEAFKAIASRDLLPTDEGYQTVKSVQVISNPEVANVDASQGYTTTFLDQLREWGLNDELGVPGS